eukprot:Seg15156.2 transcript_id=Seg15156.2/GoldUCD/mRNA.D3Y31 product="hypothetical protein" protein_id=Seg15156.2/GoldUCD/D3Y31
MKIQTLFTALLGIGMLSSAAIAKPHKKKKAKRAAIKEENILDRKDTHGPQVEAGKDKRPAGMSNYHTYTFHRIKALLGAGKITEEQGTTFKTTHTDITRALASAKASGGGLSSEEVADLRGQLDSLNDSINVIVGPGDADDARTPLLNKVQHKLEEKIEAGVRYGRLSKGEASSLRRKLARLAAIEERYKSNEEISQREREKLFEEAQELKKDLHKSLTD